MKSNKPLLKTLPAKVNYSTAIGIFLSLVLCVFIIVFAANDPLSFVNLPGLVIVIGGTVAAIFLSYPLRDIKHGLKSLQFIFFNESLDPQKEANEIIAVSRMWFNKDKEAIEHTITSINNPYLRTGFQLVVDNTPVEDILSLLKWRIARLRAKEKAEANIFYTLASYSPAFGMLGTLIAMINMLQMIELKDIAGISYNMGSALITTFYGLILANLIFNPIAIKMERRTEQRIMIMSMVMEGITLIADRRSPSFVRETLKSFIMHYDNELKE